MALRDGDMFSFGTGDEEEDGSSGPFFSGDEDAGGDIAWVRKGDDGGGDRSDIVCDAMGNRRRWQCNAMTFMNWPIRARMR